MYIENSFSLNKKKFNKFIFDYKEHFIVTIEKLRSEMIILITFIHKAKKRLRNNIQFKIVIDYKFCRDIKFFNKFEIKE